MLKSPVSWILFLPVVFVWTIILVLYATFIVFVSIPRLQINIEPSLRSVPLQIQALFEVLTLHFLLVLLAWSFIATTTTCPGFIPDYWKEFEEEVIARKCHERKKNGELRFCKYENCYKPDRAHFCRQLRRNVLRMDHYCPWVANCIGFFNHKYFLLTLFYTNLCGCYMFFLLFKIVPESFYDPNSTVVELFYISLEIVLVIIYLCINVPFFIFHLWFVLINYRLLIKNKTTIELLEQTNNRPDGIKSVDYNFGFCYNLKSVLGSNIFGWILPIGIPYGNGVEFPCKEIIDNDGYKRWPSVDEFLNRLDGKLILDVGCGNGKYLKHDKCFVIGVDICKELLEISSKKNPSADLCWSDCLNIPFIDESFDVCLSIAVIHHLSTFERRSQALAEMARVTKNNGELLIYLWSKNQNQNLIGARQFDEQHSDVLVPWKLQGRYSSSELPETHMRYYHLFTREEIEELIQSIESFQIISISQVYNNWAIHLIKQKKNI